MEQNCNQLVSTAVFCFDFQFSCRFVPALFLCQWLFSPWQTGIPASSHVVITRALVRRCQVLSLSLASLDYLLMQTLLLFQAATVSGAALASPAQFRVKSVQTAAFHYVTYSARLYCQPVRCHCLCLLHYFLCALASDPNMGSRWDTCKTDATSLMTLHIENNCTFAPCRALTARTLWLPVSVCGAPGVRCIVSWNIARKAPKLSTCSLQRRRIRLETLLQLVLSASQGLLCVVLIENLGLILGQLFVAWPRRSLLLGLFAGIVAESDNIISFF